MRRQNFATRYVFRRDALCSGELFPGAQERLIGNITPLGGKRTCLRFHRLDLSTLNLCAHVSQQQFAMRLLPIVVRHAYRKRDNHDAKS